MAKVQVDRQTRFTLELVLEEMLFLTALTDYVVGGNEMITKLRDDLYEKLSEYETDILSDVNRKIEGKLTYKD